MNILPSSINLTIEAFADLPGIGSRSAERLVFSLLKNQTQLDQKLGQSIINLKKNITECSECFNFCEKKNILCPICQNFSRDKNTICIVENSMDLIAIERTHEYQGLYHVLGGIISPINKVRPEELNIQALFDRIQKNTNIEEIILALSNNIESEATILYLIENMKKFFNKKISRLSRGIPSGGDLDYLDSGTLCRAMLDRQNL